MAPTPDQLGQWINDSGRLWLLLEHAVEIGFGIASALAAGLAAFWVAWRRGRKVKHLVGADEDHREQLACLQLRLESAEAVQSMQQQRPREPTEHRILAPLDAAFKRQFEEAKEALIKALGPEAIPSMRRQLDEAHDAAGKLDDTIIAMATQVRSALAETAAAESHRCKAIDALHAALARAADAYPPDPIDGAILEPQRTPIPVGPDPADCPPPAAPPEEAAPAEPFRAGDHLPHAAPAGPAFPACGPAGCELSGPNLVVGDADHPAAGPSVATRAPADG